MLIEKIQKNNIQTNQAQRTKIKDSKRDERRERQMARDAPPEKCRMTDNLLHASLSYFLHSFTMAALLLSNSVPTWVGLITKTFSCTPLMESLINNSLGEFVNFRTL